MNENDYEEYWEAENARQDALFDGEYDQEPAPSRYRSVEDD